jgi:hypothetical protein
MMVLPGRLLLSSGGGLSRHLQMNSRIFTLSHPCGKANARVGFAIFRRSLDPMRDTP